MKDKLLLLLLFHRLHGLRKTHMIIIFDDKLSITQIEDAVISLGLKRADWADTNKIITEDQ